MPGVVRRVYCRALALLNVQRQPLRRRVQEAADDDARTLAQEMIATVESQSVAFAVINKKTLEEMSSPWTTQNTVTRDGVFQLKPTKTGRARTQFICVTINPALRTVQFDDGEKLDVRVLRVELVFVCVRCSPSALLC